MLKTLNTQVKDIMHYGVITVPERTSAVDMCRVMSHNHVSCVAVANAANDVVGVVSSTDILACGAVAVCDERSLGTSAGALMTSPPLTVDVGDSVQKALETMVGHHVHRLMVSEHGHIMGIISTSDIVREIGKTVRHTPEAAYTKMERFEAGIEKSGQSVVARETVYDVMTHGVLVVPMTLTLRETAKVISEKRVHRVIVASEEGEMVGVAAAFDVLRPWTGDYGSPERDDVIAADIMTQDIEAIEHWRTLSVAMQRMASKRIHALLVLLSQGEIAGELAARPIMSTGVVKGVNVPIGLISATDIVREIGRAGGAPWLHKV